MNLLLYSWNANNEQILADNLIKLGFHVVWFRKECRNYTRDMELAMEMIPFIHGQQIEAVVSFNYFPIIAMICNTCQIPYYAWVYDCPHFTLYAKQITLPCNHIGIFDRDMVSHLEGYGVKTTHHVPLAVDTVYFHKLITHASEQDRKKYQCDISFVGSLYTGEYNYYDTLFKTSAVRDVDDTALQEILQTGQTGMEAAQGYVGMDDLLSRQCFSYRKDSLKQMVKAGEIHFSVLQSQMEEQGLMLGEDYFAKVEDILLAAVLEKKITVEERRILLTEIINRKYDFRLYTGSDTKEIPELDCCNQGTVVYHTQMPLVFAGSRINLNIALRSIHSGIPLRVLDIMACSGFVLSNWQPEIAEYFVEGEEIVTFDSLTDCLDKIDYYLTHEKERRQIAENGYKKVQEAFSYKIGLERLFS